MANLTITAANFLPSAQATLIQGTAGAAITVGQTVYKDANGLWQLADSNASATTAACTGISATPAAANGQPLLVCTRDPLLTIGATVAAGVLYVVSETPGLIAPSTDLATGDITCFLFVPVTGSTTQVNFNPVFGGSIHA